MVRITLRARPSSKSAPLEDGPAHVIELAEDGPAHVIELAEDDWLMDACDASTAPLLFSCRSGECGICVLRVERGDEAIDPPTPRELATIALRVPGADERTRLGCRMRIRADVADASVELTMLRGDL